MEFVYVLEGWVDGRLDEAVGAYESVFAAIHYLDHLLTCNGRPRVTWELQDAGLSGNNGRWTIREVEFNPKAIR
ncbi:hypothetical protein [Nocardia jiangxiensis]|uniref:hypothetical protein n=1 Tax=Nocardia jiangxiensis TaxID=282685 RepID=UPI000592C7F1|nr:hypothetical protein [Nocardia jiangxiensis]